MTVETTNNRKDYTSDGTVTVFPYDFVLLDADDLDVYLDGVITASGYTVTRNANDVGGFVTFSVSPGTVPTPVAVLLYRQVPITQPTGLEVESKLPSTTLEGMSDRITMIAQQLKETSDRSITLDISSISTGLVFPSPEADMLIGWNAAGTALENTAGTPGPQGDPGSMTGPVSAVVDNLSSFSNIAGTVLKDSGYSAASIVTAAEAPADPALNGFRLSLHATNPYPGDITSALTVYSIPYKGNKISLWDSALSKMRAVTSGIISETIAASTFYYRIGFIYEFLNAGVADLEINWWDTTQSTKAITLATIANPCVITCTAHGWNVGDKIGIRRGTASGTAWTDAAMGLDGKEFYISAKTTDTVTLEGCDTSALAVTNYTGATAYKIPATPTTAAVQTEGVWFKSGDRTRRLVGLIKTNGSGTIDSSSVLRRNLSNVDNQEILYLQAVDANASWTSPGVATTQPRSGSLEIGKARAEFALALPQAIRMTNIDTGTNAGGSSLINQNRVASEATGTQVVAKCYANLGYGSNYPTTSAPSEVIGVAAGGHFIQRMVLGSGLVFAGKTLSVNGGANSLLDIEILG